MSELNCPHTSSDEKCEVCKLIESLYNDLDSIRLLAKIANKEAFAHIFKITGECMYRIERLQKGK